MIDEVLHQEYGDAFMTAFESLLGAASAFASTDGYNALGTLTHAARRLWGVVHEYSPFGFPVPSLYSAEEAFRPLLDAALSFGRAYAQALALDESHKSGMPDAPTFLAADPEAGEAQAALMRVAREAFGVEEAETC
jgi:hypothetical protein